MVSSRHDKVIGNVISATEVAHTGPAQDQACQQPIMDWEGAYGSLCFPTELLTTGGF